ncbi:MAG: cation:proton antiporter, partial [Rhizobiales bacterium]|nr:cation:proton antiporter [Hyphomicrobiales bacterium]
IVGPGGLGHFADVHPVFALVTIQDVSRLQSFGDLGILFLLFTIGLELSFARLGSIGRVMLGSGGLQVVLATAGLYGLAAALGYQFDASLVLGLAFALSSTAIVTQSLVERRRLGGAVGRTALGVLILQDLMVVPIVIIVGILGRPGASVGLSLLQGLVLAAIVIVAVIGFGRFIIRPLMRFAGATGNRTLLLAITLLIILAASAITASAGLSAALGAFLAGLLLSETEYRQQLDVDIEPFKDLLLGLFFMTVGMTIDLGEVSRHLALLLGALAAIAVVKLAAGYLACRLSRLTRAASVETAFILSGAGEFAFVVFTLAARDKVIDPDIARTATTIAALSMVATPLFGLLGARLAARIEARGVEARHGVHEDQDDAEHVIICGFGRFGAAIGSLLAAEEIPYVALDLDSRHVEAAKGRGLPVFYGDATHAEILKKLGAERARAFVVHARQLARRADPCACALDRPCGPPAGTRRERRRSRGSGGQSAAGRAAARRSRPAGRGGRPAPGGRARNGAGTAARRAAVARADDTARGCLTVRQVEGLIPEAAAGRCRGGAFPLAGAFPQSIRKPPSTGSVTPLTIEAPVPRR